MALGGVWMCAWAVCWRGVRGCLPLRVPSRAPILRACFPEGKIVHGISPPKIWPWEIHRHTFALSVRQSFRQSNFKFIYDEPIQFPRLP